MDKLLVKFALLFSPLLKKSGIQPEALEIILLTKLKMDGRRSNSFNRGFNKGDRSDGIFILIAVNFLMSAFTLILVSKFDLAVTGLSFFLSIYIVILTFTLISEFTEVILDVKDNFILLPRPVNDKTISASRILHVFIYLFKIMIPYSIPGIIYVVINYGLGATLIFFFQMILCTVISLLIVNLIYLALAKYVSSQKFKDVLGYFQIAFSMLIFAGYYALPNLFDFEKAADLNILDKWWALLIPGSWAASLNPLILDFNTSTMCVALSAIAFLLPLTSVYLIFNVFAKNFNQRLVSIAYGGSNREQANKTTSQTSKNKLRDFWAAKITASPEEEEVFKLSWNLTGRNRTFKLRTYPVFGMLPAFFIYLALDKGDTVAERVNNFEQGSMYVTLIYMSIFGILTPLINSQFSDNPKASWIYNLIPTKTAGPMLLGNLKCILVKFGFPIIILSTITILMVWGVDKFDSVLIGMINTILFSLFFVLWKMKRTPFSIPWQDQSKGSQTTKLFIFMFLLSVLGLAHYLLLKQPIILWSIGAAGLFLIIVLYKYLNRVSWNEIVS